jgi:Sulfotransferase family
VRRGALPNLIMIGTPKCATTAVHYYLHLHPETSMSQPSELNFFVDELDTSVLESGDAEALASEERNWRRGVDWYASQFAADAPVRGESSPSYVSPWYPGVPERMAAVVPEARLLFCVRDPIERAISEYLMMRAGQEQRPLETALASPTGRYVALGRYWSRLQPFLAHFPPDRLLVVDQDELRRRRRETIRAIYRFAGLDESFSSPQFQREPNRTGRMGRRRGLMFKLRRLRVMRPSYRLPEGVKGTVERLAGATSEAPRPQLDPALRAELSAIFADEVERVREFTGQRFAGWSV